MINDICESIPRNIGRSLFVDDFAIWCCTSTAPAMARQLQLAVACLERWSSKNGFRFSVSKTVGMHFCRRRRSCPDPALPLYGQPVPFQRAARFLGVTFDVRLSYKEHFKTLREKCFTSLNLLKMVARTSYGGDRKTMLLLYRSLVRSKLDYACFIYDSACTTSKRSLDVVHHSALRIVTGAFRTSPSASLLAEAHESPLLLRREMFGMRYACKLRPFPDHPAYSHVFSHRLLA